MEYTIGHTWDGRELVDKKVVVSVGRGDGDHVDIHVHAPFYNDPPSPVGAPGKPFQQLWDYEVVEAFFLNDTNQYLEVELCPHGQHLLLLLNGRRNIVKDMLPVDFTSDRSSDTWTGTAHVPFDYFPPNVTRFNAYAIHGSGEERQYKTYRPVPGEQPDFHRLEYFERMDFSKIVPGNSQSSYTSSLWTE